MKKNKKTIILVAAISITLIGILVLILSPNLNLLSKLRSSIIDPTTGDICIEDTNSSNIIHENGDTVKKILDELYAEKDSTCSAGYKCNKPTIPAQVEPDSCFTLPTTNIMYSKDDTNITVENALKELYTIYNSANFCPQKYCDPITYTISLDKNGGTSQGTPAVYQKYNTAVYLDEAETRPMTASNNPITKPSKVYTISYDANGQGATYTASPTSSTATFKGYYTAATGGVQMINADGNIVPANFPNNKYTSNATLYAQYENTSIKLPAITKANATCKWAEGSSSGTQYTGGTSRTISGNITYYAKCVANPIITVINRACDQNGDNCTEKSRYNSQKAYGTTETINPTAISGYQAPGGKSVTYNGNHTLVFNHTAPINLNFKAKYVSSQLRALHVNDHTDIHTASNWSRSYLYAVPPDYSSIIKYVYDRYSSSTYSGFPYLFPMSDSLFSGYSYSNGVKGTYYIRTCDSVGIDESCTMDSEELRPYFEIRYDLQGGTGTTTAQSKYAGQSITLHRAPTRSGYTYKGWIATNVDGQACISCYPGNCGDSGFSYYAAGTVLDGQDWNVGNESWPCPTIEMYTNNTNVVYLRAVWNKDPWIDYN